MEKHTPGPWIANGPTICAAPTDAAPIGYQLAHILNPYAGAVGAADRVAANAALIAAAPDLLAALRVMIPLAERGASTFDRERSDLYRRQIEIARAAIAAAEEGQP